MQALLKNTWIVSLLLLSVSLGVPQLHSARADPSIRVSNVRATVGEGKITVTYDLEGPGDETYNVVIELHRRSAPQLSYYPNEDNLKGAVGEVSSPGTGKTIEWRYAEELKSVAGDDFYIIVTARIRGGTSAIEWVGRAALAAGVGYAAYAILHKPPPPPPPDTFPPDPGRP